MQSYFADEHLFIGDKRHAMCEHFLKNDRYIKEYNRKLTNEEVLKLIEDATRNVKKLPKIGNKK